MLILMSPTANQAIERLEAPGDILRDVYRGCVRKGAEIITGAADDIVGRVDIRIGKPQPNQGLPQG